LPTTTPKTKPTRTARVAALAMLAQRRLTEAQLWKKLEARGYEHEEIDDAIGSCKNNGYVDDRLYAALYVEGARKAVGDARLCADLVKRGIDREAALEIVADAQVDQNARIESAYLKIRRIQPDLSYPSVARKLERLGFPTSLIYSVLRRYAAGVPLMEPLLPGEVLGMP
jgi:SOS response regulatory protein OraA/RecX